MYLVPEHCYTGVTGTAVSCARAVNTGERSQLQTEDTCLPASHLAPVKYRQADLSRAQGKKKPHLSMGFGPWP